jgi:multiple antibiotic resistance protein
MSLDAFAVAGGAVLIWIGFSMLRGDPVNSQQKTDNSTEAKRSVTPVILFAASPGTITGVITLAVAHSKKLLPITTLVAVVFAAFVMWIVLAFAVGGGPRKSESVIRDTTTRFMGLIIVAMGVQFALTALQDFFYRRS